MRVIEEATEPGTRELASRRRGLRPQRSPRVGAPGRKPPKRALLAGRPGVVPSTRAMLGALLCLLAGLLTYEAIARAQRPPTTRFAIATRDLAPGDVLGEGDVEVVRVALPRELRARAVEGDPRTLAGVTVLGPIAKGELLQRGGLIRRSTPAPTFSFPIQAEYALAGRIRSGMRVSIYGSGDRGSDATTLIAPDVLVVRSDGADAARGTLVITIALDPGIDEAAVVAAATRGHLALVATGSPAGGTATGSAAVTDAAATPGAGTAART